jgi:hypothetical protein
LQRFISINSVARRDQFKRVLPVVRSRCSIWTGISKPIAEGIEEKEDCMPKIFVHAPSGVFTAEARACVAAGLTELGMACECFCANKSQITKTNGKILSF